MDRHLDASELSYRQTTAGYVLSEVQRVGVPRLAGVLGGAMVVAGLGLLFVPLTAAWVIKTLVAVFLLVTGPLLSAACQARPITELEVDLNRQLLRKRRVDARGQAHLVAQYDFAGVSGLKVEGKGGRARLVLQAGENERWLLMGAAEALQSAARRIGTDLLAGRQFTQAA